MTKLLKTPDSPWVAFLKGAGATLGAVGLPLLINTLFLPGPEADGVWFRLEVGGAIAGVFCFVAGGACALWALVQRRAYDRVTSDPFH